MPSVLPLTVLESILSLYGSAMTVIVTAPVGPVQPEKLSLVTVPICTGEVPVWVTFLTVAVVFEEVQVTLMPDLGSVSVVLVELAVTVVAASAWVAPKAIARAAAVSVKRILPRPLRIGVFLLDRIRPSHVPLPVPDLVACCACSLATGEYVTAL